MSAPAPAAQQQQQQPQQADVVLCIVTNGRHEASLACASSLLRLQMALMCAPRAIRADMHFVRSVDDGLNALRAHPTAAGAALLDASMGFDPEFPLRAMASGLPVVAVRAGGIPDILTKQGRTGFLYQPGGQAGSGLAWRDSQCVCMLCDFLFSLLIQRAGRCF